MGAKPHPLLVLPHLLPLPLFQFRRSLYTYYFPLFPSLTLSLSLCLFPSLCHHRHTLYPRFLSLIFSVLPLSHTQTHSGQTLIISLFVYVCVYLHLLSPSLSLIPDSTTIHDDTLYWSGPNVIELFSTVIYCHSMVKPLFCVNIIKTLFLR